MHNAGSNGKVYLYLAIAATAVSAVYFSLLSVTFYDSYNNGLDMGLSEGSMYYLLSYPSMLTGLQYLVFANHIEIDQYLLLPFFYLYQSGVTLLILQAVIVSVTGLVIFLVSRDLGVGSPVALALCLVFLLNPGTHGLILFDYHAEIMIPLFTILTFYFYMKLEYRYFLLSLLLLVFTIDTVSPVVIFLGFGLLYYAFIYVKGKEEREKRILLALFIAMVGILAYVLYYIGTTSLAAQYQNGAHGYQIAQFLRMPGLTHYLNVSTATLGPFRVPVVTLAPYLYTAAVAAIVIAVFALGISVFADPLLTLILVAPWIFGLFFSDRSSVFTDTNLQYFSYVLGSAFVAAMLGVRKLQGNHEFGFPRIKLQKKNLDSIIISSMFSITILALGIGIMYAIEAGYNLIPLQSQAEASYGEQVQSVSSMIPQNASLMTQDNLFGHLYQREYVECDSDDSLWTYYFEPQYILISKNTSLAYEYNFLLNYTEAHNYTLYAKNGSTVLYKAAEAS